MWQNVPASYAHAFILSEPDNAAYWQGQLDINGCTPSVPLPASGSYRLQQATDGMYFNGVNFDTYHMSNGVEYSYEVWGDFTAPTADSTITVNPSFNNDAIQAAAIASRVVAVHAFFDNYLGWIGSLGIWNGTYTIHTNEGCSQYGGDSCAGPGIVHLGSRTINGAAEPHWKFIIAHEIGHMVEFASMGDISRDYELNVGETACQCNYDPSTWGNTEHCLQSGEQEGVAEVEGFAQSFATKVFNNWYQTDGTLVYYKPFRKDDGTYLYPPMARDSYNDILWEQNHCAHAGRGVEWDWSAFLFDVSSYASGYNATSFPELFDIYKIACNGNTSTPCTANQTIVWSQLEGAAQLYYGGQLDSRYLRFQASGLDHGVNY